MPIEVRPTLGSWLIYGLGSENENLPGYIDIAPTDPNRPSGFLPSEYIGTALNRPSKKSDLKWENLEPQFSDQKQHIDFIELLNRSGHSTDKTISQMEMAFRMQTEAPGVMDINKESEATKKTIWNRRRPHR